MEYIIRDVVKDDLPGVVELCAKHAAYERAPYNAKNKAEQLALALFADRPALFCLVVTYDSAIVGYCSYTFDYATWDAAEFLYVDCLYLEADHRGKRLGENIFEQIKAIAALNSCLNIQWQTPVFNEGAIKFYKRIGGTGNEKMRFSLNVTVH
jgi:GNAT superfamily N-acetyltransferase